MQTMETADMSQLTLDLTQSIEINSPVEAAFEALVFRLSSGSATPDNTPMPMVLEQWPGGRWYRDLGADQGHLWGFVQVYKPPTLIEVQGPMFMSYAVSGHIQLRLTETDKGCELSLRHRAVGLIEEAHREGVVPGWRAFIEGVKRKAEGAA